MKSIAGGVLLTGMAIVLGGPLASASTASTVGTLKLAATVAEAALSSRWAMPGARPAGSTQSVMAGLTDLPDLFALRTVSLALPSIEGRSPFAPGTMTESTLFAPCNVRVFPCALSAHMTDAHEWAGRIPTRAANAKRWQNAALTGATALPLSTTGSGAYAGKLTGTLPTALTKADLPIEVRAQLGAILAGPLTRTTPARSGDYYHIVYERVASASTRKPYERITAVEIRFAGKTVQALWFKPAGKTAGSYYSFEGRSLAAEPFAMPVQYRRVSSPFGHRIHPVSGKDLFHAGADLTAPTGTPVVAAAAGIVQFVGFEKGYGRHIIVRHPQGYTTYYAHLSAFAKGLRVGEQVAEGQSLGAVGTTGVSTGPHLHFELRLANRPIDPLTLTSRSGATTLARSQRAAFDQVASVARSRLMTLQTESVRTASVDLRTAAPRFPLVR